MDGMSTISEGTRLSVGNNLASVRLMTPGAPAYDHMTQALVEQVKKGVAKEAEKKRCATKVLFPYALDQAEYTDFSSMYPEYHMVPLAHVVVNHTDWHAHRFMAINACLDGVAHYATKTILIGDGLFQVATRGMREVHLESDPTDSCGCHSRYEMEKAYVAVAKSRTTVEGLYGYPLSSAVSRDFFSGSAFNVCVKGDKCGEKADAMVFDLSMHPLSVTQACTAMVHAGAKFAEAFLPYTPDVFRQEQGDFGVGSGVAYERVRSELRIVYPNGEAGVASYPIDLWAEWLKATTVAVTVGAKDIDFRLELMQQRGPFMYCRLVRLEGRQSSGYTKHALEMPWANNKYIFEYTQLKSLSADVKSPSSWVSKQRVLQQDIVEKLYLHALSLPQESFTVENIMQRVARVDSRMVTSGVNVRMFAPLEPEVVTALSNAIFAKAFNDRYNMGKLGADLMGELKASVAYSTASTSRRIAVLFCGVLWENFWNPITSVTGAWKTRLAKYCSTGTGGIEVPTFVKAPRFIAMTEYNSWYYRLRGDVLRRMHGGGASLRCVRGATHAVVSRGRSLASPSRFGVNVGVGDVVTRPTGILKDDVVDTGSSAQTNPDIEGLVAQMSVMNDIGSSNQERLHVDMLVRTPEVPQGHDGPEDFYFDPDPATTMTLVGEAIFPGLASQEFSMDRVSMRYDPQHRDYQVEYMKHPLDDPTPVSQTSVYKSKVLGNHVERQGQSLQETLTSLNARTMAAPAMRVPTDEMAAVYECVNVVKSTVFRDDCEELLAKYAVEKVAFEEEILREWAKQAKPQNVKKVYRSAMECIAIEDARPWEYEIMVKADAKPAMSTKPLREVTAAQLIVMQDKYVSSMYSSIFRVMSRRLMSLLRPEIMVNLIKGVDDIRDHIAANHPWGANLKYLENDFSKFDKSQDRFSYMVMCEFMRILGFDQKLLDGWLDSNTQCVLKSMALGILLVSRYQNKSGGPATALMNVVMNLTAVCVCYKGTVIRWMTLMGDDSLVACDSVCASDASLRRMSELFNFEAKFYVLRYPYFTSCFVLIRDDLKKVFMVPDPVKRLQKFSVSVNAANPPWEEMAVSAYSTLADYRYAGDLVGLEDGVRERYGVDVGVDLTALFNAIATVSSSAVAFRSLYEEQPTIIDL